jgi:2-oxoglutarate ferredoxin oxidoreductase subunit gamma
MAFKYSIRLSGAGGHGLIQAARIIAEAAAIYDNKNASESCSYGPEARGSASRAEIIVSDEPIDYPRVEKADFLVALTQQAYDKYISDVKPGARILVDSQIRLPSDIAEASVFSIPLLDMAERECGKSSMVNIIALGFFAGVNDVIAEKSIRQAMLGRIPKNSETSYMRAFEVGLTAVPAEIGK